MTWMDDDHPDLPQCAHGLPLTPASKCADCDDAQWLRHDPDMVELPPRVNGRQRSPRCRACGRFWSMPNHTGALPAWAR